MIVKVNGERLDVVLEGEKNALQVVESLIKSVNDKDALVSSIQIDGKYFSLEDQEFRVYPVEKIGTIEIELSSREELATHLLNESKGMLKNIADDLRANTYAHTDQFLELFNWISGTIQSVNDVSGMNMAESRLLQSTIKQIVDYLKSKDKEDAKAAPLASVIDSLGQYIDAIRLKMTADFDITSVQIKKEIDDCLALLPEISSGFQTGKDREALGKINQVINTIELCSFYLQKNIAAYPDDVREDVDEFYGDINTLLNQIVGAFENGDVVLLGDLMEYELPDKLKHYRSLVLEK
jgi:hypothetical protein